MIYKLMYLNENIFIISNDACPDCGATGHDFDADFCKYCGHPLEN